MESVCTLIAYRGFESHSLRHSATIPVTALIFRKRRNIQSMFAAAEILAAIVLSGSAPRPESMSLPVSFRNGKVTLAGTLFLPQGTERHPAVVLFHSANGGERDFHAYQHLATVLPGVGIAVLLYDRRGSGASTGNFNTATFEDLARDGIAAVRYLKTRSDIDRRRIGAWGVSQGGWVAPLAATLSSDIAFVVAVSAPGVTPAAQMDYSATNRLRTTGWPHEVVEKAIRVRDVVNDYYRGRASRDYAQKAIMQIRNEPWFNDVFLPNGGNLPDDPTKTKWRGQMDYDPLAVFARVRVPTVFFFAEHDAWVPVEESINNVRRVMSANPQVTIERILGTDHLMENGIPDSGGETSRSYIDRLLAWFQRTIARKLPTMPPPSHLTQR